MVGREKTAKGEDDGWVVARWKMNLGVRWYFVRAAWLIMKDHDR